VLAVFSYLLLRRGKALWRQLLLVLLVMVALTGLILVVTPVETSGLLPMRYLHQEDASFLVGLAGLMPGVDSDEFLSAEDLEESDEPAEGQQVEADGGPERLLRKLRHNLLLDLRNVVLPVGGGASEQALVERLGLPSLSLIAGAVVLALVVLGFGRWLIKDGLSVMLLFAPLYAAALLFWNWYDTRLLYPIQPQLFLAFLLGLEAIYVWIGSWQKGRNTRRVVDVILVATTVLMLLLSIDKGFAVRDSRLSKGDLALRTSWLKAHAAPDAILMSEVPLQDYLYGGRKTVGFPASVASAQELAHYMTERGVNYVLIAPNLAEDDSHMPALSDLSSQLLPLLSELVSEGRVKLVYESDRDLNRLFEVQP
jgi:hypothetical protein